ncbi:MAG TPA: hypothetical protein VM537_03980 [Anaerolineae bacterium]|nr:hypothetical protein [Anaerolineae bacterium]
MALAITSNQTREFVLSRERNKPQEKATVFIVRPITTDDEVWMTDYAAKTGGVPLGQAMHRLVPSCVVGWRNFQREDGSEVECVLENNRLSDESYRAIARLDRIELTYDILNEGSVGPDVVGKSASQRATSGANSKPAAPAARKTKG